MKQICKNCRFWWPEKCNQCRRHAPRFAVYKELTGYDWANTEPDDGCGDFEAREIHQLPKTLTYRERAIIRLRWGLNDGYKYTLEEVAQIFKVTQERIRQIEAKAKRKIENKKPSDE